MRPEIEIIKRFDRKLYDNRIYRKYYTQILGLNQDAFADTLDKDTSDIKEELKSGRLIVVFQNKSIIGFMGYTFLNENPEKKNEIELGLDPANLNDLKMGYGEIAKKLGCEAVAEYFENEFTQGEIGPIDNGICLDNLVVRKKFRMMGVGTEIAKVGIELAIEHGKNLAFCQCGERRGSEELFLKLEFYPILRTGPMYDDGSSAVLMGKLLKV
jgi:hypothetical protein